MKPPVGVYHATCDGTRFNEDGNAKGDWEESCLPVATGSCEPCSTSSERASLTCDDNRFTDDGLENNGSFRCHTVAARRSVPALLAMTTASTMTVVRTALRDGLP